MNKQGVRLWLLQKQNWYLNNTVLKLGIKVSASEAATSKQLHPAIGDNWNSELSQRILLAWSRAQREGALAGC